MRSSVLPLFVLVLTIAGTPARAQDAPQPLFDGRTLSGWRGDPRFWSVIDGAIVGRSTAEQPCSRNTYLVHEGTFADFELSFSYRITGGNSGVQYRSRDLGDFVVAGYQADIEAGPSYTGILYEEKGRGIVATRGQRVHVRGDGARELLEPLGDAAELQRSVRDGWNDYVVRAEGARVVHIVNGVTMIDVVDEAAQAPRRGCIALQLHAGPPMEVRFRDLRIRPLGDPSAPEAGALAVPEWIWAAGAPAADQRLALRRTFELPSAARAPRVVATCDNRFTLFLDGVEVLAGTDWQRSYAATSGELSAGVHVLAAEVANEGGPAAFSLRLTARLADGSTTTLISDASWRSAPPPEDDGWLAADFDDSTWSGVRSFGPTTAPDGPWSDPFAVRQATPAAALTLPDGYVVELVHSAQPGEGSWIALGFEADGDVLVSQERGPLTRIVRGDEGAGVVLEEIANAPRGSQGFCTAFGALYVQGAGAEGHGLYRLRDADGDGRYEIVELLEQLGGGGEHGAHAVVPGPDGRLWLMNGNMSPLPATLSPSSPHASFAEDVLLPVIEDPRGHANGVRAPGGHVLRTDADGEAFELFAAGFRNPYDIAFGPDGELFTFDADMEWDIGLPWYRPTRIVHVVSGGEWGWRTGAGKWPVESPDSLPAVVDVGLSSPTGMVAGAGLAFPAAEQRALFVGDWAYGRILAVHLEPAGASYTGTFEHFVTGKPLNVTDLAVGPDGALWFTTGGRGTQSGLYRVTYRGGDAAAAVAAAGDDAAAELRALRRELEAMHGRRPDRDELARAWECLGHGDRFVRYAARIAVEFAPVGLWAERALAEPPGPRALEALLALARKGEAADRDEVLRRLGRFEWRELDRLQRFAWLRVHAVALARRGGPIGDELRYALLMRLDPRYPTGDAGLDSELLDLLVFLRGDVAVRALQRLEELEVQRGIDVAYALRLVPDGFGDRGRERFFRWLGAAKAADGGMSFRGYLEAIERDALEHVPEAARAELQALAKPPARQVPNLAAFGNGARAWTVAELEPFLPAVGHGRDFDRGAVAYEKAICATCHRFDGRGGAVGPDLTAVASRFSRLDLLRTIVEPSADVSDQYQNHFVTLRSGRTVLGRIVREDAGALELIVDPFTGKRERIAKPDIAEREPSAISPMPPGLIGMLTLDEVLDLLAYLESGGNRQHPAFDGQR